MGIIRDLKDQAKTLLLQVLLWASLIIQDIKNLNVDLEAESAMLESVEYLYIYKKNIKLVAYGINKNQDIYLSTYVHPLIM